MVLNLTASAAADLHLFLFLCHVLLLNYSPSSTLPILFPFISPTSFFIPYLFIFLVLIFSF